MSAACAAMALMATAAAEANNNLVMEALDRIFAPRQLPPANLLMSPLGVGGSKVRRSNCPLLLARSTLIPCAHPRRVPWTTTPIMNNTRISISGPVLLLGYLLENIFRA